MQSAVDYHWLKNAGGGLTIPQLPSVPQTGMGHWAVHDAELASSVPGGALVSGFQSSF